MDIGQIKKIRLTMKIDPSKLFNGYSRHYTSGSKDHFRPAAEIRELHLTRLPPAVEALPKEARILDAGCANGYSLYLLRELGFVHLTGVDVSEELLNSAKDTLGDSAALIGTSLEDYLRVAPGGCFDAILLHHVIEHIPRDSLLGLLTDLHRCLAPNGLLSVKTPNASCILAGHHLFGDFTHVNSFNERSLLQVLEGAGFDSECVEFTTMKPKLFFTYKHPLRSILRVVNRLRWHLNSGLHAALYILADIRPRPHNRDWELSAIARREPNTFVKSVRA